MDDHENDEVIGWAQHAEGGPAWHDPTVEKLNVNIEDSSRLRKLKNEEAETHISGEQYTQRLQKYYEKATGQDHENDLFSWAKPVVKQFHMETEPEDEDPISKLLKSNTKVF